MSVWVVIPVFNEAPTIARVVRAAHRHARVLVVDDGSTDGSGTEAVQAGAEVLRHGRRLGKGQALRTGISAARRRGASLIATLDGDGQHDPDELPQLLVAAREAPRAIVIGNRLGGRVLGGALPSGRLHAIRVAGFFVQRATGFRVTDTQSGFRVYHAACFDEIRPRRGGFVFETEVLIAAARAGFRVHEVPITAIPRASRRSRFRPLADGTAIGAFIASRVLLRWAFDARAGLRGAVMLFDRGRRRRRHAGPGRLARDRAASPEGRSGRRPAVTWRV